MYIHKTAVGKLAKEHSKRVGKSFYGYLERRIYNIIMTHIGMLGSKKTLNAEDAETLDAYRLTKS